MNNTQLNQKISEVYAKDSFCAERLKDYIGNMSFMLQKPEIYMGRWVLTHDEFELLKTKFWKVVWLLSEFTSDKIIDILQHNTPTDDSTNSNIEAIERCFLNYN